MNLKRIIVVFISVFSFNIYAQENNIDKKVVALREQLSVREKIDLLCAKAPDIEHLNMVRYDWWSECLHGVARAGKATVFPKPIGLGSTWDIDLINRISIAISDEARAKYHKALREKGYTDRYEGLTFFSPTLNLARDPRWGRTSECFSEDPFLTGELGTAFVRGLQGDDLTYLKLVATPKHFVANNEENRRLNGSAEVDEVSLREYYFPAFRSAVSAGASSVMGAYNALNGIPCCASPFLLNDVLRKEWGFEGVVISDGSAIDKIFTHHKYSSSPEEGAAIALKAGCDMSLRDEYREGLWQAYEKNLISMEDIDTAVSRVLRLRMRLGIDDSSGKNPYTQIPDSIIECFNHRQLALEASCKSMVLLKNEDILPLNKERKQKIGLIGEAFKTVYYGDYSGLPDQNTTLWECIVAETDGYIDVTWVSEQTKEKVIPSNYLTRSEEYAYDGRLGFTGEYFNNKQLLGSPVVVRQDLTLDLTPVRDEQLRSYKDLSARWTSVLYPPATGAYTFYLKGSGETSIYVNDSLYVNHRIGKDKKAVFNLLLAIGEEYNIRIECKEMYADLPLCLTWTTPLDKEEDSPEVVAQQSDVVILFLRDDNSSEGKDRISLDLSLFQQDLIDKVTNANPNTILILGSGTALSLSNIIKKPKALMNVWISGQGEAQAINDILFGKINPSGKTAITFFANENQLPSLDDYNVRNGRSYQYFDGDVLFPFGYGLSYTTFTYSSPVIDKSLFISEEKLMAKVYVTNNGAYDGEEIVQCYLSSPEWEKEGLKQKLIGFKRVFIKRGESKEVEFIVSKEDLLRWNMEKKKWDAKASDYEVSVAPHSGVKNSVSFFL